MKRKFLILIVALVGAGMVAFVFMGGSRINKPERRSAGAKKQVTPQPDIATARGPAHYEETPSLTSLGPTLSPAKFTGVALDAYQAAREIPQTLAQLPCYCHCDQNLGHKSLLSCFEDDHAAHCAVCAGEGQMAYRLQKEQKLSVAQIRE